jgi:hypothetical protein
VEAVEAIEVVEAMEANGNTKKSKNTLYQFLFQVKKSCWDPLPGESSGPNRVEKSPWH